MAEQRVVSLDNRQAARRAWNPTTEQLAELPAWAAQRLLALEKANKELANRLAVAQQLAQHDDISGLPNHRAATAMLERTLRRHLRNGRPFALLFFDGDNLRLYNEGGYEAGNRMIARLAGALAARLRPTDYLARWLSGDEFLAIVPDLDGAEGAHVAERLRIAVEEEFKDALIPVTVSVGIAAFPDDGATAEELVARAVTNNAAAKRAGKNRIAPAAQFE